MYYCNECEHFFEQDRMIITDLGDEEYEFDFVCPYCNSDDITWKGAPQ